MHMKSGSLGVFLVSLAQSTYADLYVRQCCQLCGGSVRAKSDEFEDRGFGERLQEGCCCCRSEIDELISFQVLDLLATCTHHVAWNYYRTDMVMIRQEPVSVPTMSIRGPQGTVLDCKEKALSYRRDLLSRTFQTIAWNRCPAPGVMALLMEAESALLTAWPYSVWLTDRQIFGGSMQGALAYLRIAEDYLPLVGSSPQRMDWPLEAALSRVSALADLIAAGTPPDPRWYHKATLLGQYQQLIVFPSSNQAVWNLHEPGHLEANWPTVDTARDAFRDAISAFHELGAIFFPVKGSLIGILRYGASIGELADGKVDMVDNDLDFWVQTNYSDWGSFCHKFTDKLIRAGWSYCMLHNGRRGSIAIPHPALFYLCEARSCVHSRHFTVSGIW